MSLSKTAFRTLFLSTIVFSCLEPQGENYVPITSPEESNITVNLFGVEENDTIYIDGITTFTYEVDGFPLMLTGSEVKLNSQMVYIPDYSGNSFVINPKLYPEGFYKMHVKLIARSESGSLAARLNEETIEVSLSLNVILDSTPAPVAEITKIDTTGGVLTIHWNKYDKRNFASYTVRKECPRSNDPYSLDLCEDVVITDPSITSWTDHDYVGGRVKYAVHITTHLQTTFGTPTEFWWKPTFTTNVDEKGNATIRWHKTPFYLSTKKYIIEAEFPIKFESPITDTVYLVPDPLRFAILNDFKVTMVSDNSNRSQTFLHQYYLGTRYELPTVRPLLYHAQEKLYYGRNGTLTVVMDENLNVIHQKEEKFLFQTSISSSYFVTLSDNNFYNVDPYTLEKTLLMETGHTYVGGNYVIAENGLIGFPCWKGFRVMDSHTGQEKFAAIPNNPPYYKLSTSGKYLIGNNKAVYRYDGNAFAYEGTMPASFDPNYTFIFNSKDNIVGTHVDPASGRTQIIEYDITTRTAISTIETMKDSPENLSLDPVSKKVLVDLWTYALLLDPETQKISNLGGYDGLSLLNGKLFAEHYLSP
ncbi:MAG TPA: hypothetical protein VFZ52_09190, partial [Chryseolinea sp.]